jgi:hypothetical protein
MVNVSTKDYEEIATMEEVPFPASVSKSISQKSIPGLHKKVKSTKHYNLIMIEGNQIFIVKENLLLLLIFSKEFWSGSIPT